jgi:hypothetical protein
LASRNIEKIKSRKGMPVLQVEHEGKMIPIHSKYDPMKEAERVLDRYKDEIERYDHVLFYGVGLGYHVKLFFDRYPTKLASTYEPIVEVFNEYVDSVKEIQLPVNYLEHCFVEETPNQMDIHLSNFSQHMHQKVLVIVLPIYEKIAKEEFELFSERFQNMLQLKKSNTYFEMKFGKRWTLNALMNLKQVLETRNILLEEHNPFEGKPVILAAAGPSLSEEMENLRLIKEQGLAYIFAVGSANKALIAQGIYPDAVITYDPQSHNHLVFHEIIDQKIDTIPMIFGSTVGFETVQKYRGPKFHFLTSQDTVSPYFLEHTSPTLNDSSSIAIVTLQLLHELKVAKVILVGQNFAFKSNLFYSKEIERYDDEKKELVGADVQAKDVIDSHEVDDTLGGKVTTNNSFDRMRKEMEQYIQQYSSLQIINTTKGGAAIKGTVYQPLAGLMKDYLTEFIISPNWYRYPKSESSAFVAQKLKKLQHNTHVFISQYEAIMVHFKKISSSINSMNTNQISKSLETFDDLFKKFTNNILFSIVMRPITRVHFEKLQAETDKIRVMEPSIDKVIRVINVYMYYLSICHSVYKEVTPVIQSIVFPALLPHTDWKEYVSTSGIFHYEGEWEEHLYENVENDQQKTEQEDEGEKEKEDKIPIRILSVRTKQKNAKIKFRFSGRNLALYGENLSEGALNIKLSIDNKVSILKVKESSNMQSEGTRKMIYKTTGLNAGIHHATIEIVSDRPDFLFYATEIDEKERIYHLHEVMSIDELEIGKLIRCHYKASRDTVGEFSGMGEETSEFIPVESCAEPNGDFYFIMVDQGNGEKKLIADRNVQNSISWDSLNNGKVIFGSSIKLGGQQGIIRSLTGGSSFIDNNGNQKLTYIEKNSLYNEWDHYIKRYNSDGKLEVFNEYKWKYSSVYSWCQETSLEGTYVSSNGREFNSNFTYRVGRGSKKGRNRFLDGWGDFTLRPHYLVSDFIGFRPVLEY